MNTTKQISTQAAEKRAQLDHLQNSLTSFLVATDVPEQAAAVSPREGCWSILQITEHLTIVEYSLMKRLREGEINQNPPSLERDDLIYKAALDRSKPRTAPEFAHPTGRFATLADARAELKKRRQESIVFIESNTEDMRKKWVKHPLTEMDGHQLILLMSNHLLRHVSQIEEIKASLAYKNALEQKAAS